MILPTALLGFYLGFFPAATEWKVNIPSAQADTIKVWNLTADRISADPLGQYYIIRAGSLVRYDAQGDSTYSWSEPQSGRITMIDTSDPMRILVYQKDFNLLRFLNNRLAPLADAISLDDMGLTAPLALAVSRQGGFWVFDGSSCRIRLMGRQLETLVESAPLNLPPVADPAGYRLMESGDRVLLLFPGREIQVFDLFANLVRKIPTRAISFHASGDQILLAYPDKISLRKDPVLPEETLFQGYGSDIREAFLFQNKLFIRTHDRVVLLKL
jgi:hypothetical protein